MVRPTTGHNNGVFYWSSIFCLDVLLCRCNCIVAISCRQAFVDKRLNLYRSVSAQYWKVASNMANIGIYILCGGASSRMGTCKATLSVSGKSMVQHIVDRTSTVQHPTFLVGKSHQQTELSMNGVHWIEDDSPQLHPLHGVVAALKSAQQQYFDSILILPCDTPFASTEGLHALLNICPSVAVDPNGNIHPLLLHIPTHWLHRAQESLRKHASMKSFAHNIRSVRLSHRDVHNINRPSDIPPHPTP